MDYGNNLKPKPQVGPVPDEAFLKEAGFVFPSEGVAEWYAPQGESAFSTQWNPEKQKYFIEALKKGMMPQQILKMFNEAQPKVAAPRQDIKTVATRLSYNPDGSIATDNKPNK
jgi:hypothetical protein